ncbi:acyltransferase family protein [Pararhizobium gei]|uniref:acyltransferase family protein n=1 Tax=Pararhizobium gei TaxID=1395951 RepID=UPI0023DA3F20|nr:acyltransferase [Rhizobium gei]
MDTLGTVRPSRLDQTGTSDLSGVRFSVLDSWRGICALLVAMMHFPASGPLSESLIIRHAYLFVDYFFVLSGFVIAHRYRESLSSGVDYLRFGISRVGRIYPLHFAVLMVFLVFELLRLTVPALRGEGPAPFSEGNSIPELINSLLMLNGTGVDSRPTWNSPSWSISAEIWTYLIFGLAVMILGRRHWIVLVAVVIAGMAAIHAWSPTTIDTTWHLGLLRCLYGFSLGALLYHWLGKTLVAGHGRARAAARPSHVATLAEVFTLAGVLAFVSVAGRGPANIFAPFVFALSICVFSYQGGLVSRVLNRPAFLWLGTLSYGIYMVHIFVQSRMINVASVLEKITGMPLVGSFRIGDEAFFGFGVQGPVVGTVVTLTMIAAVIATALVAHFLVERPGIRLSRALAARLGRKQAVAEPSKLARSILSSPAR